MKVGAVGVRKEANTQQTCDLRNVLGLMRFRGEGAVCLLLSDLSTLPDPIPSLLMCVPPFGYHLPAPHCQGVTQAPPLDTSTALQA